MSLQKTGNQEAFNILTEKEPQSLPDRINEKIKRLLESSPDGGFEGISAECEWHAHKVMKYYQTSCLQKAFMSSKRRPLLESFDNATSSNTIWWNPLKPKLPQNYIERTSCKTNEIDKEEKKEVELVKLVLSEVTNDSGDDRGFVFLVDPPGMGKSCAMTKLEIEMRSLLVEQNRLVLRVDLNKANKILDLANKEMYNKLSLVDFLRMFAPYIPTDDLVTLHQNIHVYLILDGLDEVRSIYKEIMLKILDGLLFAGTKQINQPQSLYLARLILTSRPHLKQFIEEKYRVASHSLVPLSHKEQKTYLRNEIYSKNKWHWTRPAGGYLSSRIFKYAQPGIYKTKVKLFLKEVSSTLSGIVSSPLMLAMLSDIVSEEVKETGKLKSIEANDKYKMYLNYMVKKHEIFVLEKEGTANEELAARRIVKGMLEVNEKYYNFLAIKEILSESQSGKIFDLGNINSCFDLFQEPSCEKLEELQSYGIIHETEGNIKFKHRSFAEFFYARLLADVATLPQSIRDALYIFGFVKGECIDEFLKSALKNVHIHELLSSHLNICQLLTDNKSYFQQLPTGAFNLIENWVKAAIKDNLDGVEFQASYSSFKQIITTTYKVMYQWRSEYSNDEARRLLQRIMEYKYDGALDIVSDYQKYKRLQDKSKHSPKYFLMLCDMKPFARDWILCNSWIGVDAFTSDEMLGLVMDCVLPVIEFRDDLAIIHYCRLVYEKGPDKMKKNAVSILLKIVLNGNFGCGETFYLIGDILWKEAEVCSREIVDAMKVDKRFEILRSLEFFAMLQPCTCKQSYDKENEASKTRAEMVRTIQNLVNSGATDIKRIWIDEFLQKPTKNWDSLSFICAYANIDNEEDTSILSNYILGKDRSWEPLDALRCYFLSVVLSERDHLYVLLKQRIRNQADRWYSPALDVILKAEDDEIIQIIDEITNGKVSAKLPFFVNEIPAWQVVGRLMKRYFKDHADSSADWKEIWSKIFRKIIHARPSFMECGQVEQTLNDFKEAFNDETYLKEILSGLSVKRSIDDAAFYMQSTKDMYKSQSGLCFVKSVLRFYFRIFENDEKQIFFILYHKIPLELLTVADELEYGIVDYLTCELRFAFYKIDKRLPLEQVLEEIFLKEPRYKTEGEWIRFLKCLEFNVSNIRSVNEKVYTNSMACVLRVFVRIYGKNCIRDVLERTMTTKKFSGRTFWDTMAEGSTCGELLYLAVELESLIGVKQTASPLAIIWKNEKGQSALELAMETLDQYHPIVIILRNLEAFDCVLLVILIWPEAGLATHC